MYYMLWPNLLHLVFATVSWILWTKYVIDNFELSVWPVGASGNSRKKLKPSFTTDTSLRFCSLY